MINITIEKTIKRLVNTVLKDLVSEVLKAFDIAQQRKSVNNCFSRVEKLLYNYNTLKYQVEEIKKDLKDMNIEVNTTRSKDIIFFKTSNGISKDKEEIQDEKIQARYWSMKRTESEIKRVENALDKIKDDKYYKIIELKYFDKWNISDIASALNVSETTIKKNTKELINTLSVWIFGIDAL